MFKFISISLFLFLKVVSCYYYVPVDVDPWMNSKTPLDLMVDVTNRFGLRILYEHNFFNGNNIAFSPYGLTGIMIALYEGVNGESSYQIQQCLSLPWEKDLVRVGFRDIHRTLKTYFIPEEGFLAGLALNNDNITFNQQYNNVLQFYGFDFESGLGTTMSSVSRSTFSTQITTTTHTQEETTTKDSMGNTNTLETKDEQTPMATAGVETKPMIAGMSPVTEISSPSPASTTESPAETELAMTLAMDPNATSEDKSETTLNPMTTTLSAIEKSTDTNMPTALPLTMASYMPTTINMDILPETTIMNVEESSVTDPEITTLITKDVTTDSTETSNILTSNPETSMLTTSFSSTTTSAGLETTTDSNSNDELITEKTTTSTVEEKENAVTNSSADENTSKVNSADIEITTPTGTKRRKRSLIEYVFQPTANVEEIVVERPHFLYTTRQSSNYNIFTENMFLVDGLRQVEVSYMTYNSILDYAYVPHLKASALRLPLDSEQYYLLIILPDFHFDLNDLIKLLAQESDLRDIYSSLRSTYVQACVPSFMVKGYVSLTTDLQRLGIRKVFEPRQSDFTPMTSKSGVYVRNIEQAVTVTIHKYEADGNLRRIVPNGIPVRFSATYPFLYLVMDSKLHVALMAGKMVDPLNSRIL